eukprot:SM000041S15478  [mRNA]  locus=s41:320644:326300:+ [translate_table: standard]
MLSRPSPPPQEPSPNPCPPSLGLAQHGAPDLRGGTAAQPGGLARLLGGPQSHSGPPLLNTQSISHQSQQAAAAASDLSPTGQGGAPADGHGAPRQRLQPLPAEPPPQRRSRPLNPQAAAFVLPGSPEADVGGRGESSSQPAAASTAQPLVSGVLRSGQAGAGLRAGSGGGRAGRGHVPMTAANHLLNFKYESNVRPAGTARSPAAVPTRRGRQRYRAPAYDRELFLQANFRFLVSDLGDYAAHAADPDRPIDWGDVAAVYVAMAAQAGAGPPQCPICLDAPLLCPQITACGHVFCFPCILRHLLDDSSHPEETAGGRRPPGEHFRRCPLCAALVGTKDLRTAVLRSFQTPQVGDTVRFALLQRSKVTTACFERAELGPGVAPPAAFPRASQGGGCHLYSKLTLTDDAGGATEAAASELTSWAEAAQAGGGAEDLARLPYIFAAMDQLKERQQAWTEHRASEFLASSPPVRQRILAQARATALPQASASGGVLAARGKVKEAVLEGAAPGSDVAAAAAEAMASLRRVAAWTYDSAFSDDEEGSRTTLTHPNPGKAELEHVEEEDKGRREEEGRQRGEASSGGKESDERGYYAFYQASDGQSLVLHPLVMRCLLSHYGSYDALPLSLESRLVEAEVLTQTEGLRRKYRFLSHLPLTAAFTLCEVDLGPLLPPAALAPLLDELQQRRDRRRRRARQEQEEQLRHKRAEAAEVAAAAAATAALHLPKGQDFAATLDGFPGAWPPDSEGTSPPSAADMPPLGGGNTSDGVLGAAPPAGVPIVAAPRMSFSRVAELGFASGLDAPGLQQRNAATPSDSDGDGSSLAASPVNSGWGEQQISFADAIQVSRSLSSEPAVPAATVSGKKGRRGSKVLLSTGSSRRY